ncbi:MAG TPA: hypothetical protein VN366_03955 [Feifaniaceae bacterium]|nr:hypothetical protein [Feifaniaceae bacterium]
MNITIIAYSNTGSAEACARALSGALGARLFLLEETRQRPGKDFFIGGMQAVFHLRSKLKALPDVKDSDVLILGMPVWAGTTPPAINALLQTLDCAGKTVFAFVTKADPAPEPPPKLAIRLAKQVEKRGGTLKRVFALPVEGKLGQEAAKKRAASWAAEIRALLPREAE